MRLGARSFGNFDNEGNTPIDLVTCDAGKKIVTGYNLKSPANIHRPTLDELGGTALRITALQTTQLEEQQAAKVSLMRSFALRFSSLVDDEQPEVVDAVTKPVVVVRTCSCL